MTFTGPRGQRQRIALDSFVLNPFNTNEVLTFDAQHPWIAEMEQVGVAGFRVATFRSTAAGRRTSIGAPMGFYRDAEELRQLLFADFPDFTHGGGPMKHPLVAVIPEGEIGAGSIVVRHTGRLRSRDIPLQMRDHVEIEAYTRASALEALQSLGYVRKVA